MQGTKFTGRNLHIPAPDTLKASTGNYRHFKIYGLELGVNDRICPDWRTKATCSGNQFVFNYNQSEPWFGDPRTETHATPRQTLSLPSLINLSNDNTLDTWARYADNRHIEQRTIPVYSALEGHPHKDLELSCSGKNPLDILLPEFSGILCIPAAGQFQPSNLAQISWYS